MAFDLIPVRVIAESTRCYYITATCYGTDDGYSDTNRISTVIVLLKTRRSHKSTPVGNTQNETCRTTRSDKAMPLPIATETITDLKHLP